MRTFLRFFGFAAAAILLLSSAPVRADITWNVPSGDWSVATNWSGGTVPTSTDNADIYDGGTVSITETGETCSGLSLGGSAGSGTVQMTSGSLDVTNPVYVGSHGAGLFAQSGGMSIISSSESFAALEIGRDTGSAGTYTLSGTGQLMADYEYVGYSGTGVFTQTGGTNDPATQLYIGFNFGSSGTYNLDGGVLRVWALSGGPGTALFNFGGGTLRVSGSFAAILPMTLTGSGGNATVDTAGYAVTLSGSLSGPGGLTKTDSGTLVLGAANTYTGDTLISGGTLKLTNTGALQQSTLDTSGAGSLTFGGLTAATFGALKGSGNLSLANTAGAGVALTVGQNNASTTYTGCLSGSGGLTKAGTGTLTLANANLYTGPTVVEDGTLEVANGGNGAGILGNLTLSGGTLASGPSREGVIGGEVAIGSAASEIAPGGIGSTGTLYIGSLLTGSNLTLDFDLTTPGGSNDLLAVTGNLTLAPNTAITFGTDPTTLGDYRLISYGSLSGSLSDLNLPAAPPNTTYSLSTTVNPGYIDLVVVPEPSTLVLLGVAAAGLLGCARRRRRR